MINVMVSKEGTDERCMCYIKGSVYDLAMEYTVLSKKLAENYPHVIELSQVLLEEASIEEVKDD